MLGSNPHVGRVYYVERGRGLPVVLLHGFPLDGRIWDAQLGALSDRFRIIVPDLPGFGRSSVDRPFTIASLADDLRQLLVQIQALPCVLGGLSMGGYVSLAYITKYPSDLLGLMLIDSRAEADTPEAKQNRDKMIQLVRTAGAKAIADPMLPKLLAPAADQRNPGVVAHLRQIMEACPRRTIEFALAAMRDRRDCCPDLPSIAVPTLIIAGEEDVLTPPALAHAMAKEIPHAKVSIIPESGHMTPMEQPDRVNAAMREFLAHFPQQPPPT
ncbi:MAG: alpha/beta fold hydrolase [Planctomycetota bacterium]|nr:alpha/beta fold hydrolase [Planctomycetota bacterium]